MTVEIKDQQVIITLPIKPEVSKSGKSLVLASTHGNQPSDTKHGDKIVFVGANVYVSNR